MNRRTVIKNLALAIGGTVLLPSCLRKDGTSYIQLKHIQLDESQQTLIADMAETIIPKTNTPGAKDLNLPAFVLKMIDDCFNKKKQGTFLTGLNNFTDKIKKEYGKPFGELDSKQREAILTAIDKANNKAGQSNPQTPDPINEFYSDVKWQTILGY